MAFRVSIDVGGTFTDFVVTGSPAPAESGLTCSLAASGGSAQPFHYGKTPSTPGRESVAVMDAVRLMAAHHGLAPREFLARTEVIHLGTTVVTNAMLEHKGVPTGMLTTRGFRDVIELRRGYKESLFDIRLPPPRPIVRRRYRIGITERIDYQGHVVTPLADDEIARAVDRLRAEGIVSYAVCFLQSHVNPTHERRAGEIIAARHPAAFVTLSSDVLTQIREFERFSTTLVNAFLSPVLGRYVEGLIGELRAQGFPGRLLVMQSHGGMVLPEVAGRFGAGALLSGPAGGVVAAAAVGEACGHRDVIGVDMGGTSYDVSLIRGATPQVRTDAWVARYRIGLPMLDIHTIGAGGGSIAWIDGGGALRVGPQSAGANPGPACYGREGREPTVTDANLVLGYLNPEYFLGGRIPLYRQPAEEAVTRRIAEPLGLSLFDAALGISRIVNNNMSNGMRYVSVARGHDPRDLALMAFGGAAAIHAPVQARDLGIRTILVPKTAAVFCALGELLADLKVSRQAPYARPVEAADPEAMTAIFRRMVEEDAASVGGSDVLRIEPRTFADLRYVGQVHELTVPIPNRGGTVTAEDWAAAIAAFHDLHERIYTFQMPERPVEVLTLRQDLVGVRAKMLLPPAGDGGDARSAVKGRRPAAFPGEDGRHRFVDVPVYAGERIAPDLRVEGPAVIEEPHTTLVLYPGDAASLNAHGVYVIAVGDAR
ncbi:MAG: hydantoinase/oxoprolinase family protein [Armatimonadetes bacterium]|nr:hydantoinase/oxoprolinase family protein [Armatimonadota bacterium]